MAYLYELLQYLEVAEDHVGAGAADGEEKIVVRGAEIEPTFFGGGVQLGVFAGDLMRGDREASPSGGRRLLPYRGAPHERPRGGWPDSSGSWPLKTGLRRLCGHCQRRRGTFRRRPKQTWRVGEDARTGVDVRFCAYLYLNNYKLCDSRHISKYAPLGMVSDDLI